MAKEKQETFRRKLLKWALRPITYPLGLGNFESEKGKAYRAPRIWAPIRGTYRFMNGVRGYLTPKVEAYAQKRREEAKIQGNLDKYRQTARVAEQETQSILERLAARAAEQGLELQVETPRNTECTDFGVAIEIIEPIEIEGGRRSRQHYLIDLSREIATQYRL